MTPPPSEPEAAYNKDWATYHIFCLSLVSDFPFANRLAPGNSDTHITFTCDDAPPLPTDWKQSVPAYTSPYETDDGESIAYVYQMDTCTIMHFTAIADFYLQPGYITCHLLEPVHADLIEIRLLGPVLSLWLEQQGIPALHASAVIVNNSAVVFLSSNKGGKSTLAATLMQTGHPLLTDDILPVVHHDRTFLGCTGYPTMRMWPDEAQYFLGHYKHLEPVLPDLAKRRVPIGREGFGTFCERPYPIACIYLPERRNSTAEKTIEILPLPPAAALIELARYSYIARIVAAMGLQPQRLDLFTQLVQHIPLRRIIYPHGFEHLSRVRDTILKDLDTL